MSIISQIGGVILIAFIVLVLIRSNKNLKKASEEGESFVDEWALRQEKKEEIKQKREEKKLEVQKEKKQKKIQKQEKRKGNPIYENTGEVSLMEDNGVEEVNQKDLEHIEQVTHPTMTGIIKRLETKGFLICAPSENDRRYKKISSYTPLR